MLISVPVLARGADSQVGAQEQISFGVGTAGIMRQPLSKRKVHDELSSTRLPSTRKGAPLAEVRLSASACQLGGPPRLIPP